MAFSLKVIFLASSSSQTAAERGCVLWRISSKKLVNIWSNNVSTAVDHLSFAAREIPPIIPPAFRGPIGYNSELEKTVNL